MLKDWELLKFFKNFLKLNLSKFYIKYLLEIYSPREIIKPINKETRVNESPQYLT